MNQKRVFLAINLPEELKEKIYSTFSEKLPEKELKKVEKENLHVTLLFIGYVPENYVKELKEKLQSLSSAERFDASLKGIGCFGNRVLWLGVDKNAERIVELNKRACELLGIRDERFNPHVTLARNKRMPYVKFAKLADKLKKIKFEEIFPVESVDIMESILLRAGPVYKKLAELKLTW